MLTSIALNSKIKQNLLFAGERGPRGWIFASYDRSNRTDESPLRGQAGPQRHRSVPDCLCTAVHTRYGGHGKVSPVTEVI